MSCESYDWKSYALNEMDRPARHEAEAHIGSCAACREELASMRLTLDALSTLRDEEIPRRIAFVSDQIFEPRWYQRAFRALWTPNFAAACVIAAAILVHGLMRPAVSGSQIDAAVNKAVAAEEQRHAEQLDRIETSYSDQTSEMYKRTVGLNRP